MDINKIYKERFALEKEYLGTNKAVNKVRPLVSVCTATYQHKDYIKDCIEGALMQQTNFDYEIIIGEDESTDGTRAICKAYAEKYPDKIRLFLRNRETSQLYDEKGNLVTRFNGKWCRASARGQYIALCEGDDYWTDPYKLQKQVDFMSSHQDVALTYHKHQNVDVEGNILSVKKKFLPCTTMFVNELLDLPDMKDCPNGDRFLLTYFRLKGNIEYLDNIGHSVRRFHEGGVMSMVSQEVKLDRQAKTWSVIYDAFKHSKLSKELYHNRNRFIYRNMVFKWKQKKMSILMLIVYPIKVRQIKLYKFFLTELYEKNN